MDQLIPAHICRHSDPVAFRTDSLRTMIAYISKTLNTPVLPQVTGVYNVPHGFDLLFFLQHSNVPHEARSELLTNRAAGSSSSCFA